MDNNLFSLQGKTAIVTGGALGIGAACARQLARAGAKVVVADVNEEAGSAVAADIPDAIFVRHDVSEEQDWTNLIATTQRHFGAVDTLVNNAGVTTFADIEHTSLQAWERIQRVNSTGAFLGCRAGVAAMKERGGAILNVSSIGAIVGMPAFVAYCASKGAVRALTKSVAAHCIQNGYKVRCNSIHPGPIDTTLATNALRDAGISLQMNFPTGMGVPDDIAGLVVYLASDAAKFANGAEFTVDGGYIAL